MPILNHLLALVLLTASAPTAAVRQPAVIDRKQADEGAFAGDLWIVNLETRAARRITRTGGYRSPIFLAGDRKLLALKGEDLIEIPVEGGEPKK
ncbi:MAG TPA: hypothetical protein VJ302_15460, partial [Blastocatellia bacterium]|nr:hypothetical protein [Blastocatellia bacterium]